MEVWSSAMGPERVLPNSEDELGEDERPADGALLPVWRGGRERVRRTRWGRRGEMELDGEEEEEEVNSGGYYYQPLNQEPDGANGRAAGEEGEDGPPPPEQVQQVQQRIQVLGLHLPEAPPADSDDEEEDPDGAAALRSRASIPMDDDHVELVKRTMAAVALPSLGVPSWATEISDDQWKDMVQNTLESRQSSAALRLPRRNNINGP
ncbi:LOW QUALITY PROTEIN: male-enhanced antigen 1 [Anoplopoma fimbria]|uniref:LOW QUALITY PROTEIN: male-enhanced antigen 1 n=1 Tax=Anoplopoma fimbria TaxID=229290 RepID=UPI0023ED6A9A|nr:LOW QUALITY PROTEIN: male-enhanced antigen 1 [Anoplopoma fimbria]